MVPILDMAGKVVGFGGRELPEEVTKQLSILCLGDKIGGLVSSSKGEKEKKKAAGKYINSPSSPGNYRYFCFQLLSLIYSGM